MANKNPRFVIRFLNLILIILIGTEETFVHAHNPLSTFPKVFSNCVVEYIRVQSVPPREFIMDNSIPKLLRTFDPNPERGSWVFNVDTSLSDTPELAHNVSVERKTWLSRSTCYISAIEGNEQVDLERSFMSFHLRRMSPNFILILVHAPFNLDPRIATEIDTMQGLWITSSIFLWSLEYPYLFYEVCHTCSDSDTGVDLHLQAIPSPDLTQDWKSLRREWMKHKNSFNFRPVLVPLWELFYIDPFCGGQKEHVR